MAVFSSGIPLTPGFWAIWGWRTTTIAIWFWTLQWESSWEMEHWTADTFSLIQPGNSYILINVDIWLIPSPTHNSLSDPVAFSCILFHLCPRAYETCWIRPRVHPVHYSDAIGQITSRVYWLPPIIGSQPLELSCLHTWGFWGIYNSHSECFV